jgi:molybdate transport system substrate-binding protein
MMPVRPRWRQPRGFVRVVLVLLSGLAFAGCGDRAGQTPDAAHEVRVAAAADLRYAFDDVIAGFRRGHPEIAVSVTYGSSGQLYAQIANRAPFDLFLSADKDYPHKLAEQGLVLPETEFVYAIGRLVVWVPAGSNLDVQKLGIRVVLEPSVRKVAIANPRHAPYGRAAEAALKNLEVYDAVRDRLVFGENIAQTAQYVESGAADVGLLSLSLALAEPLRDKGRYATVPDDAYPRLEQGGVIVRWAQDRDAARRLRDYLRGPEGKAALRHHGFSLPEG